MPRCKKRQDQSSIPVIASMPAPLLALGYEQVAGLDTAKGLTAPDGAIYAMIQAEGASVRWRDDGVAPSATVGMRLPVGSELHYDGNMASLRVIQEGSGAKLNISYYG